MIPALPFACGDDRKETFMETMLQWHDFCRSRGIALVGPPNYRLHSECAREKREHLHPSLLPRLHDSQLHARCPAPAVPLLWNAGRACGVEMADVAAYKRRCTAMGVAVAAREVN